MLTRDPKVLWIKEGRESFLSEQPGAGWTDTEGLVPADPRALWV